MEMESGDKHSVVNKNRLKIISNCLGVFINTIINYHKVIALKEYSFLFLVLRSEVEKASFGLWEGLLLCSS